MVKPANRPTIFRWRRIGGRRNAAEAGFRIGFLKGYLGQIQPVAWFFGSLENE